MNAWGKRRNADGTDAVAGGIVSATKRGFTGHEHMDDVGLINMNARVYDAAIGRFTSPDPVTADAYDVQSLNRYAYVDNRPLSLTDPTGMEGCYPDCDASSSSSGRTTTIIHADGTVEVRHGNVAFRDNNPGNLRPYDFSKRHGMIGVDEAKPNGAFAVFENSAVGEAALRALLKSPDVQGRSIEEEMKKFSPDTDKNDPKAYARMLSDAIGMSVTTKMSDLTSVQMDLFVSAVKQKEGYNDPNGTVKIMPRETQEMADRDQGER